MGEKEGNRMWNKEMKEEEAIVKGPQVHIGTMIAGTTAVLSHPVSLNVF